MNVKKEERVEDSLILLWERDRVCAKT